MKKSISALLAMVLVISCMACAFAESAPKYTTETTADGWIKVEQTNGPTLGYSPDSGVSILEVEGLAFKDMNRNGKLDPYEDWREDADTRAADLVSKLSIHQISGLRANVNAFNLGLNGEETALGNSRTGGADFSVEYAIDNYFLKAVLTHVNTAPIKDQVAWNNKLQILSEKEEFAIPVVINSDPVSSYSQSMNNLSMAATFDPDTAGKIANEAAKLYRAVGITEVLGPQIDTLTEPRWSRASGTFGDDPALSRDMANAIVSGFQSTYSEDGTDMGWGKDSIISITKHWPGDSAGEGGRESHRNFGAYTVYPGDSFTAALVPFVDGGMNLTSITEANAGIMTSYSIAYTEDESLGELVGSAFSEYKVQLLRSLGYDGMISTDGLTVNTTHGVDNLSNAERAAKMFSVGIDQALWAPIMADAPSIFDDTYALMVEEIGEEATIANYHDAGRRILRNMFRVGSFENAYVSVEEATALLNESTESSPVNAFAQSSIVMLKNSGLIQNRGGEKQTVYVPYSFKNGKWELPASLKSLNHYFNVVTDTVGTPTGEADSNGNATYTVNDITRASEDDIAKCDFAIAFISNPSTGNGYNAETLEYLPISLQYEEYVAISEGVREESISGNQIVTKVSNPYGEVDTYTKENRSYYGKSTVATNHGDLELVQWLNETLPENVQLVTCVTANNPMVFGEIEPLSDVILVSFGVDTGNFLPILAGQVEPTGLLPVQMPKDMDAVEAQYEDVPRDAEVYVDSEGNAYDFTFGMNWSGVIDDARTAKYNVAPLTTPEHLSKAE